MDLFSIVFNALSPYLFAILKLALAVTLFTNALKIIRSRSGGGGASMMGGNPYSGVVTAFVGYLFGRGIPVLILVIDRICADVMKHMH
jgi:hypothetical protein